MWQLLESGAVQLRCSLHGVAGVPDDLSGEYDAVLRWGVGAQRVQHRDGHGGHLWKEADQEETQSGEEVPWAVVGVRSGKEGWGGEGTKGKGGMECIE